MALTFTAAGAVATPGAVQLRVRAAFPGRVAAGAPEPTRDLTPEEVRDNLRYFTVRRRGPRSSPCHTVILSGERVWELPVEDAVLQARQDGVSRVVVHLSAADLPGFEDSALASRVDRVAVTVTQPLELRSRCEITAVVRLNREVLPILDEILASLGGVRVVLTWPFPPAPVPPPVASIVPKLLDRRGGIKGLPACQFPPGSIPRDRLWRSSNRFYVDADHQGASALLFFPDVVRYEKLDACRFCSFDSHCDGVVAAWLERGLYQPVTAV